MFSMAEVLCEVHAGDTNEQGLPPGFRFHPSDEELITFYLASKVFSGSFCGVQIAEIDLNRCEPWELPDVAKMGEREWYFFSQRDRKYPTGLRTNRATVAGYWKATGKDKEVYSASNRTLLGMKKTLVFYKGRAPRGAKTKWVMHEYRLEGDFSSLGHMCKEEWVLCRILQKTGIPKKSASLQSRNYLHNVFSSPPPFLPPTLESNPASFSETPTHTFHECKSLQNPYAFPPNNFQPSFSPAMIINSNPLSSITLKPPISHQDITVKQGSVPKQPKTEANFSQFQSVDANFYCLDRLQQNLWQDPLSFELDCNTILGFSAGGVDTVHELSTPAGFDKTSFDMMLDLPIIR